MPFLIKQRGSRREVCTPDLLIMIATNTLFSYSIQLPSSPVSGTILKYGAASCHRHILKILSNFQTKGSGVRNCIEASLTLIETRERHPQFKGLHYFSKRLVRKRTWSGLLGLSRRKRSKKRRKIDYLSVALVACI